MQNGSSLAPICLHPEAAVCIVPSCAALHCGLLHAGTTAFQAALRLITGLSLALICCVLTHASLLWSAACGHSRLPGRQDRCSTSFWAAYWQPVFGAMSQVWHHSLPVLKHSSAFCRHSSLSGSDDLDRWAKSGADSVREAYKEHLLAPMIAVKDELFKTFRQAASDSRQAMFRLHFECDYIIQNHPWLLLALPKHSYYRQWPAICTYFGCYLYT